MSTDNLPFHEPSEVPTVRWVTKQKAEDYTARLERKIKALEDKLENAELVYISAVQGRKDFRDALRKCREEEVEPSSIDKWTALEIVYAMIQGQIRKDGGQT